MSEEMPKFFEYMKFIGNLKRVQRTGWVRHGVKHPESVAEHMYRMAMISFALPADTRLDKEKCMKIALVHDMSESIVGDLTPSCGVSKAEKSKMEETATEHIARFLPDHSAKEVLQLWREYEYQLSPEAKFVKDLDKFEMIFQALEYEKLENRKGDLEEFFVHTKEKHTFTSDIVKRWVDDLVKIRHYEPKDDWDAAMSNARAMLGPSLPQPQTSTTGQDALSTATANAAVELANAKAQSATSSAPDKKKIKVEAGGDGTL